MRSPIGGVVHPKIGGQDPRAVVQCAPIVGRMVRQVTRHILPCAPQGSPEDVGRIHRILVAIQRDCDGIGMKGIEGDVRHLAWRQVVDHQGPVSAGVGCVPHLSIRSSRSHCVGVKRTSRQGRHHPKTQPWILPQGQVSTHRLPFPKRRVLHAVHTFRGAPRHVGLSWVKQDGCIPRLAVFGIQPVGEIVPIGLFVPCRDAPSEVGVLHGGDPEEWIFRMVQRGETISPTVPRPVGRHRGVARGGAVVLCARGIPPRCPRNVGHMVELANGQRLDVLPRLAMVCGSIRPTVGCQNQFIGPHPLEVMLVSMHFVRPPFWPHALPRFAPIQGVPKLDAQHADVAKVPRVHAHLGEVPPKSPQDAVRHGPFRHDRQPCRPIVARAIQVAELQVRADRVDDKAPLRFVDANPATLTFAPWTREELPRVAAVQTSVHLVVGAHEVTCRARANAMPRGRQNGTRHARNAHVVDPH